MTYIETKKAEIREHLQKKFNLRIWNEEDSVEIDTLIDTILNEIESRVCAEFEPNQSEIDLIRSAFQHLRTRVEEVKEIPGFEGTMDALGKLDITS